MACICSVCGWHMLTWTRRPTQTKMAAIQRENFDNPKVHAAQNPSMFGFHHGKCPGQVWPGLSIWWPYKQAPSTMWIPVTDQNSPRQREPPLSLTVWACQQHETRYANGWSSCPKRRAAVQEERLDLLDLSQWRSDVRQELHWRIRGEYAEHIQRICLAYTCSTGAISARTTVAPSAWRIARIPPWWKLWPGRSADHYLLIVGICSLYAVRWSATCSLSPGDLHVLFTSRGSSALPFRRAYADLEQPWSSSRGHQPLRHRPGADRVCPDHMRSIWPADKS